MSNSKSITLTELHPAKNWPAGRRPEWYDEDTRLYTGLTVRAAARDWHEIVVHHDGDQTTAYLTVNGFDVSNHGPAIHAIKGKTACYRKVLREWFRDFYRLEVVFA